MDTQNTYYWDCDCDTQFIHLNIHRLRCPKCQATEADAPESLESEVAVQLNHFLPRYLLNSLKLESEPQRSRCDIRTHEDLFIVQSAFDAFGHDYDDGQTSEGFIIVEPELFKEIVKILTDPEGRKQLLELIS